MWRTQGRLGRLPLSHQGRQLVVASFACCPLHRLMAGLLLRLLAQLASPAAAWHRGALGVSRVLRRPSAGGWSMALALLRPSRVSVGLHALPHSLASECGLALRLRLWTSQEAQGKPPPRLRRRPAWHAAARGRRSANGAVPWLGLLLPFRGAAQSSNHLQCFMLMPWNFGVR